MDARITLFIQFHACSISIRLAQLNEAHFFVKILYNLVSIAAMLAVHKRYSVARRNLLHFMEAPKRNKCPRYFDALPVTTENAAPIMIDCHFASFIPYAQLPACRHIHRFHSL